PEPAPFPPDCLEGGHDVVAGDDHARADVRPVQVVVAGGRLHGAVLLDVGVLDGVDVHGLPVGVLRPRVGAAQVPAVERGRVVVGHGRVVVGLVLVHQDNLRVGEQGLPDASHCVQDYL